MAPNVPIPSLNLVGRQFFSNNNRSLKVEHYYGRFDVVRKLQSHKVTKHNIDARDANGFCRFVRSFS